MLDTLIAFIESLGALWSFITHSVTSILALFAHIPQYSAFIVSAINVLPPIVLPFALASLSLGLVLFILGR